MAKSNTNLSNLLALYRGLVSKSRYGNDGFMFVGLVTYDAYSKSYSEPLEVYLTIGGANPGIRLDIYEKGKSITISKFHLDFNPDFINPTMIYDKNTKTLNIQGTSPKMGSYRLSISEIL